MTASRILCALPMLLLFGYRALPQQSGAGANALEYRFDGHYGQVEVGGPYAGAEFHRSRPLPSRISFYYPVANSIDLSTDYWKRGESMPAAIGIQTDGGEKNWLGRDPWSYVVGPHKVTFSRSEADWEILVTYEFCLHEPAMVRTIAAKNVSSRTHGIILYTHLKPALRTCQTYARLDSARTAYLPELSAVVADFQDARTGNASVFVVDVGLKPAHLAFDADELAASDSGTSRWLELSGELSGKSWNNGRHKVLVASEYSADVKPSAEVRIVQVIGSCRNNEVGSMTERLASSWKNEIDEYRDMVTQKSVASSEFRTGDASLDASAIWAKGVLAANAHYLDSAIVPMPCPAEYNFFFTHDVLMTDLGAVNFDLPRVKTDLLNIASRATDTIIPHAYYWRDDGFKTEYCTPDNWNHFWFILATGAYLRHSLDAVSGNALFPLVQKSLGEILTQVKSDNLMYAFRPDWWDIGHLEGPRAYMTILAIRSLREYLFISSFLRRHDDQLVKYEHLADSMQGALTGRLWDGTAGYLMNYNEGKEDKHFYMGSLLAVAFRLLDRDRSEKLLQTASRELLDSAIGVRTAMPPDFSTPASVALYKFAGEEAGKPFSYINGGVWPHDNAWFALSLIAQGRSGDASAFVHRTMTLDGIVHSPNGQPAMYEYRFSDPSAGEYGMIDKPSFLWAGGFYLKTLYALYGVRENEWNISFEGGLPRQPSSASYTLSLGRNNTVSIHSNGSILKKLRCDNVTIPSAVLPIGMAVHTHHISLEFSAKGDRPYLQSINAILRSARWKTSHELECETTSFPGHETSAIVISRSAPHRVLIDGKPATAVRPYQIPGMRDMYEVVFTAGAQDQRIQIIFK